MHYFLLSDRSFFKVLNHISVINNSQPEASTRHKILNPKYLKFAI